MRYISQKNISFSVNIDGKSKRITFTPRMDGGSIYLTNSTEEIKAIEATNMFKNDVFKRAPGQADPTKEKDNNNSGGEINPLKGLKSIKTFQDGIDYLVKKFGVSSDDLTSPEEVIEVAKKNGICFPNMA